MKFGERIRQLRKAKGLTLQEMAPRVGVGLHYLSKVENGKLDFGEYPSEDLIRKLAKVLEADVDQLLLMADKIPDQIRRRVLARPEAFRLIAELDDNALDKLVATLKVQ